MKNGILGNKEKDIFLIALLKTLNSVYEKFILIKKEGSIYAIGYHKDKMTAEMPKGGGDLAICYPEKDIVIIDKNCIKPFTKEFMKKRGGWHKNYDDKEWLLGFTAGSQIFHDIVKSKQSQNLTP